METVGRVLHEAWWYDALAWIWTGGKERSFRERLIRLAPLSANSRVLDIGCGTGTLALAVKRRLGSASYVAGIDASAEMIERARSKATAADLDVRFEEAVVEALPFPDAQFDVVFSTLMLHHLPAKLRVRCLNEVARVLKPGGSLFIADFETSDDTSHGPLKHLHRRRRHGHVQQEAIAGLLPAAGLDVVKSGLVGFGNIHYTIATKPVSESAPITSA